MMVKLNGKNINIKKYESIVLKGEDIVLADEAVKKVNASHRVIEKIVKENRKVYGVTTGFGKLVDISIPLKKIEELQFNLIRSHSTGYGEPFSYKDIRGALLLRINTIIRGNSGVSIETLTTLIEMLNKRVYPFVPQQGSVGASGDLAPLAHIALTAIGEGECIENGKRVPSMKVLKKKKIKPVKLGPKEGLALINGTQMMTSVAGRCLIESEILLKTADIAAAISADALLSTTTPFEKRITELRNHRGQRESAENMINLLFGSPLRESHRKCDKIQDAYSIRCIPQVHGASREAYYFAKNIIEIELNSSTDNPLVFIEDNEVVSGGNFHGEMIAIPIDTLKIGISEIANISDRRLYRLMDPIETNLSPFLSKNAGLNSGFMMLQVTTASLASENKILSHPASVDSIPTSLGQEDHVSMGTIGARKLSEVIKNTAGVLAIEIFAGLTALSMRSPLKSSKPLNELKKYFFRKIKPIENDRAFYKDIEKISEMVLSGEIVSVVEKYVKLK
ncbi:MAG: histidine ammonia-lyase [bacterium (Candidatus Stahlbacteria) CG23_combo_of_CG06-09_8_20_14_all_34_7]|nr:MAG: histidine ammonia-lyase [bacterium (Candidatus Stahlbacteria) CG23_combo_of_CG06-09_8_20_14_all_34_7]